MACAWISLRSKFSMRPRAGLVDVGRGTDQRDDGVEIVERLEVALEDVGARLRPAQLVLRPADDDLALEVEVVLELIAQRQRPRHSFDERDRVVAERRLEPRVLEQLVQDDLRDRLALDVDLDPHARLVRVVIRPLEISGSVPSFYRSAIFLITPSSPPFFTVYGSSVTMIAVFPPRSSSM